MAILALVAATTAGKKGGKTEKGMSDSEVSVGDDGGADRVSGEARVGSGASGDSALNRAGIDDGESSSMGKKSGMGKKSQKDGSGKKGGMSKSGSMSGKGGRLTFASFNDVSSDHVRTTAAAAGAAVLIAATALVVVRRSRMHSGYTTLTATERTPLCAELREPEVLLE